MHTENYDIQNKQRLNKEDARQGETGFPRRVLIISLILVAIAFAVVIGVAESRDADRGMSGANMSTQESFDPTTPAVPTEQELQEVTQ
jgi:hypothetical protein